MNILFVTAYPPVLNLHGGGVRMYNNIRILAEKHQVHVLSFVVSDEEEAVLESVRPFCTSLRAIRRVPDFRPHWLSLDPFLVREFSTPEMHHAVDGMLRATRIAVLHCEYLQMAQFRRNGVFSVLTAHDVQSKNAHEVFERETDPLEKCRLFYRWMQMLRYEVKQVRKFDRVVTLTREDAEYLSSYAPDAKIITVPVGIDAHQFGPVAPVFDETSANASVVFLGNFLHYPNVEAAKFLAEELAPRFPEVRFVIAGRPIPEDLRAGPNVEFPGYIPDTQGLYRGRTVVVAPLFSGSGQRIKLLEAFSMGCSVITTRIGAMGFPIENGKHALLAETPDEFEAALQRLLSNAGLRRQIGQNARAMILERFTWERIGKDLLNVVEEAALSN